MPQYQKRSSKAGQPRSEWKLAEPTYALAIMLEDHPETRIMFLTPEGPGRQERVTEWRIRPQDQELINDMRARLHLYSSATISEQAERIYDLLREQGLVP